MFMLISACKKENIIEPRFYLIPEKPTVNDEISIIENISSYYENQYYLDVSGTKITYIRYSLYRGGLMEVPWKDTIKLGKLSSGYYEIFYFKVITDHTLNDSILEDCWKYNFSVEED